MYCYLYFIRIIPNYRRHPSDQTSYQLVSHTLNQNFLYDSNLLYYMIVENDVFGMI